MRRWKSGHCRVVLFPRNSDTYVIRNLDGAGCGCICGYAARRLCRSHEVCAALELRTHMANLRFSWDGRTPLAVHGRDRAALGRSVLPYVDIGARPHHRLWSVLGNRIGARRLRHESSRDWSWDGDHPGLERVIGITDSTTYSYPSALAHSSGPNVLGWHRDYAGGNRLVRARRNFA